MKNTKRLSGTECGLDWVVLELAYDPPPTSFPGMSDRWFCGYVRVPDGHPLHGLGCRDPAPDTTWDDLKDQELGKRGILTAFCADTEKPPRLDIVFDVHGSLTFAGAMRDEKGWWLGFDCHHDRDDPEIQDAEYAAGECRRLAKQIAALFATAKDAN